MIAAAKYTVHGVLAGALRGNRQDFKTNLYHASVDGGDTAVCGRVKAGNLADVYATDAGQGVTCERCRHIVEKHGKG